MVFNYAVKNDLVDMPVRYGSEFQRPPKKVLRKARRVKGKRMFDVPELRALIAAATVPLKAMLLLAANSGMGNSDCANLTVDAIDLKTGWVDYPRPKTEVQRRFPLWPETLAALKDAIKDRPKPKSAEFSPLVFITKYGGRWGAVRIHEADPENNKEASVSSDDPICKETAKLLKTLGLKRPGINFYAIRHTFETKAGDSRDQPAVDTVMGHDRGDMASVYREEISDDRLKAVTDHVRNWLWPKADVDG